VTNAGRLAMQHIAVRGDMIAAHASRPRDEQLGRSGAAPGSLDAPLHAITSLAPGESATFGGELQLPLTAILPIRRGEAHLFVPLARFSAQALADGAPVTATGAFVVGQASGAAAGKLQPFRLDLGPRLYSQLGQHELG
jgi:hypothetical protein